MPGNFDELIKQAMQRGTSPRLADAGINPRDIAARQMNMAERGVNSTAYPSGQPQQPSPNAAQPQPSMDSLIAAQMGEQGPIPGARPMQAPTPDIPVQQMGDASQMELAQAGMPAPTGVDQSIDAQVGEPLVGPMPPMRLPIEQMALPSQIIPPGTPNQQINIAPLIAALGGTVTAAGIASLIAKYRMGDPDAARTFQAVGMSPDDLSMFAGDVMPQRDRGTAAPSKQNDPTSTRGNQKWQKPESKKPKAMKAEDADAANVKPEYGSRGKLKVKVKAK